MGFDQVIFLDKCLEARAGWLEEVFQFEICPNELVCIFLQYIRPSISLCGTEEDIVE